MGRDTKRVKGKHKEEGEEAKPKFQPKPGWDDEKMFDTIAFRGGGKKSIT